MSYVILVLLFDEYKRMYYCSGNMNGWYTECYEKRLTNSIINVLRNLKKYRLECEIEGVSECDYRVIYIEKDKIKYEYKLGEISEIIL